MNSWRICDWDGCGVSYLHFGCCLILFYAEEPGEGAEVCDVGEAALELLFLD